MAVWGGSRRKRVPLFLDMENDACSKGQIAALISYDNRQFVVITVWKRVFGHLRQSFDRFIFDHGQVGILFPHRQGISFRCRRSRNNIAPSPPNSKARRLFPLSPDAPLPEAASTTLARVKCAKPGPERNARQFTLHSLHLRPAESGSAAKFRPLDACAYNPSFRVAKNGIVQNCLQASRLSAGLRHCASVEFLGQSAGPRVWFGGGRPRMLRLPIEHSS